MRKTPVTLLALLALGASVAAQADTLKKAAESGKITLAYRESSVPLSYLEGPGKPIGMAVDISKAVAEAVKKQLKKPLIKQVFL